MMLLSGLAEEPALRRNLARAARARAERCYGEQRIVADTLALYGSAGC
jgi:hypothetical protein